MQRYKRQQQRHQHDKYGKRKRKPRGREHRLRIRMAGAFDEQSSSSEHQEHNGYKNKVCDDFFKASDKHQDRRDQPLNQNGLRWRSETRMDASDGVKEQAILRH